MEKRATDYLFEATRILLGNIIYVLLQVVLTSCLYLSGFVSDNLQFYYIMAIYIVMIIIVPLFYGQFIEIITIGDKTNWKTIFGKYWIRVFIVTIILKTPSIIFELVLPKNDLLESVLSLVIDILTIYVLPLVLLSNRIVSSIEIGIKCLLGNFRFSVPFISILILLLMFSLIIGVIVKSIDIQVISYSSSIFLILISTFVDFAIFISAALVLKDKLLKMGKV